jgi:septum formation protein
VPPVLVLASASPRRARILGGLGLAFEVVVSGADESMSPGEPPAAAAIRIATAKARAVAADRPGRLVLAADTMVVCEGRVLGKPGTPDVAAEMLRLLSGRTHEVLTGVCAIGEGAERSGIETTAVTFDPLTEAEIAWYASTGEPLDKAGAYHVDGRGSVFIRSIDGSPSNVAGLPVTLVRRLLSEVGLRLFG